MGEPYCNPEQSMQRCQERKKKKDKTLSKICKEYFYQQVILASRELILSKSQIRCVHEVSM